MRKKVENCETCPVEDQPDPEQACEDCIESAEVEGRMLWGSLNPETLQALEIRRRIKAGFPYQKDDLMPWQWEVLAGIEEIIDKIKAEETAKIGKK